MRSWHVQTMIACRLIWRTVLLPALKTTRLGRMLQSFSLKRKRERGNHLYDYDPVT
jgi:hypothetical protein